MKDNSNEVTSKLCPGQPGSDGCSSDGGALEHSPSHSLILTNEQAFTTTLLLYFYPETTLHK